MKWIRKGHFAVVCPMREQPRTLTCENQLMFEKGGMYFNLEEDDGGTIEEVLEGSKLPVCVIRRVLMGSKKEEVSGDD